MGPARLASNKQQATSNWLRRALCGPQSRRGPEIEKKNVTTLSGVQFPGARSTFGGGIRLPQKFLPQKAQLFYSLSFGQLDPHGREIAKYWYSRPFWPRAALGTWRNSGPETEKCNFLELGALLRQKSVRAKSFSPKKHNFFTFCVLSTGPARAGNGKILVFQALLA